MSDKKRRLGNTNIEVSPLCYGCAAAYARDLITDQKAIELFQKAFELGITTFDTGHSYGKAEERIGKALKALPAIKRNQIVISTKFGTRKIDGKLVHDVSTDWIKKSVDLSLERMGIDYIDVLYVHSPQMQDLADDKMFACLDDLKRQGIIRASGANVFDEQRIKVISDNELFDVVMLDYNIVKKNREPIIEELFNKGIAVVAGQAMAESLFLNDLYRIREIKDIWYLARTFGRKQSRDLYFLAKKYRFMNKIPGYDGSQVALKYVVDNKYISTASFGTCSIEHLIKNVDALNLVIPDEIHKRIQMV